MWGGVRWKRGHSSGAVGWRAWTARGAKRPSNSLSMVNWMERVCALRCRWKASRRWSPWGQMAKTSCTYLSHILGLQGDIFKVCISRSSMKMFATINESSESTAAPYTCSRKIHQTESKWTLGTVPQSGKVPVWGCLSIPECFVLL